MPKPSVLPRWLYSLEEKELDTLAIRHMVIDYVQAREVAAAREAVKALHDIVALKRAIHVPLSVETHRAVQQLEEEIASLRLALRRRNHPDQMELPGMDQVAKEGKQEGRRNDDVAS